MLNIGTLAFRRRMSTMQLEMLLKPTRSASIDGFNSLGAKQI